MTAFDTCEMKEDIDKLDESLSLMEVFPGQFRDNSLSEITSMTESCDAHHIQVRTNYVV